MNKLIHSRGALHTEIGAQKWRRFVFHFFFLIQVPLESISSDAVMKGLELFSEAFRPPCAWAFLELAPGRAACIIFCLGILGRVHVLGYQGFFLESL